MSFSACAGGHWRPRLLNDSVQKVAQSSQVFDCRNDPCPYYTFKLNRSMINERSGFWTYMSECQRSKRSVSSDIESTNAKRFRNVVWVGCRRFLMNLFHGAPLELK